MKRLEVILILFFHLMTMTKVIDNLDNERVEWLPFSDNDMGGISEINFSERKEEEMSFYHMEGKVSTENNGGFIQIRNQLKPSISTKEYEGIYFKVIGNDEDYSIHLRTALTMAPWQYYKFSFKTNNQWSKIKAPFNEFKKSNAYQPSDLIGQKIKSIGLVAGFKDFTADICLSEIGFY